MRSLWAAARRQDPAIFGAICMAVFAGVGAVVAVVVLLVVKPGHSVSSSCVGRYPCTVSIDGNGTSWQLPVLGSYYAKLTLDSARAGGAARMHVENDSLSCREGETVTTRDGWRVHCLDVGNHHLRARVDR